MRQYLVVILTFCWLSCRLHVHAVITITDWMGDFADKRRNFYTIIFNNILPKLVESMENPKEPPSETIEDDIRVLEAIDRKMISEEFGSNTFSWDVEPPLTLEDRMHMAGTLDEHLEDIRTIYRAMQSLTDGKIFRSRSHDADLKSDVLRARESLIRMLRWVKKTGTETGDGEYWINRAGQAFDTFYRLMKYWAWNGREFQWVNNNVEYGDRQYLEFRGFYNGE